MPPRGSRLPLGRTSRLRLPPRWPRGRSARGAQATCQRPPATPPPPSRPPSRPSPPPPSPRPPRRARRSSRLRSSCPPRRWHSRPFAPPVLLRSPSRCSRARPCWLPVVPVVRRVRRSAGSSTGRRRRRGAAQRRRCGTRSLGEPPGRTRMSSRPPLPLGETPPRPWCGSASRGAQTPSGSARQQKALLKWLHGPCLPDLCRTPGHLGRTRAAPG
mmetsp:Transcript_5466/g.13254  ORF Transcript_5466/g.13254 Transcript_5466/m.13254 type:complete len:215 (-) Transcript_5466:1127-1771(-)